MNQKYLHEGFCIDSCPVGFRGIGSGNFNRICVEEDTQISVGCMEKADDCRFCENSTSCRKCMNSKYLHEGVCVDSCPKGLLEVGTGKYSRKCV